MGVKIEMIGGYADKPKSDPHGQTRIAPPDYFIVIPEKKLKQLLRHGSMKTKLAIKRALRLKVVQDFRLNIRGPFRVFPKFWILDAKTGEHAPYGVRLDDLMVQLKKLRGVLPSEDTPSPFGIGAACYKRPCADAGITTDMTDPYWRLPRYAGSERIAQDILDRNNDAEAHAQLVKEIANSPNFEAESRHIFGDSRSDILNSLKNKSKPKDE